MANLKISNISVGDVPSTVKKITITGTDFPLQKLQSELLKNTFRTTNSNFTLSEQDDIDFTSYLNTPVYGSLMLGLANETNSYIDLSGQTIEYAPLRISDVVIEVVMTKNIIKTPIQGRNGTIKQYVSDGDFEISVKGRINGLYDSQKNTILNIGRNYPFTDLRKFVNICRAGVEIPITNKFLNQIFNITHVVINDFQVPQDKGARNFQEFSINMSSDNPYKIEFEEGDISDLIQLRDILNL